QQPRDQGRPGESGGLDVRGVGVEVEVRFGFGGHLGGCGGGPLAERGSAGFPCGRHRLLPRGGGARSGWGLRSGCGRGLGGVRGGGGTARRRPVTRGRGGRPAWYCGGVCWCRRRWITVARRLAVCW